MAVFISNTAVMKVEIKIVNNDQCCLCIGETIPNILRKTLIVTINLYILLVKVLHIWIS